MAKAKGGLGFRSLEDFNLALLAKQGWRLLQHPQSLVGRIFQEKYYRGGSFLGSELGRRPSYAWRSLWSSKALLGEGLMWRVGDGRSIKIWGDRWLPGPQNYSILTPSRGLHKDATVSNLIDPHTSWWNCSLINDLFSADEAEQICNLAICPGNRPDRLIWRETKNGIFSVRSAYYLARSMLERGRGSCSSEEKTSSMWKTIWKVRGSPVVKLFLWKACRDVLATKVNLHKRSLVADPLCPICGLEDESVGHILWECGSAKDVWLESSKRIQKSSCTEKDFINTFITLTEKLEPTEVQLFTIIARNLWLRRNKYVFGGPLTPPAVVYRQSLEQLEAFEKSEVDRYPDRRSTALRQPEAKWQKPLEGTLKVNWDAAVDVVRKRMGMGVVVRDHGGELLATQCATKDFITDPRTAEAYAAWRAVELSSQLGLQRIVLEGDALEIVNVLKNDEVWLGSFGHILLAAK